MHATVTQLTANPTEPENNVEEAPADSEYTPGLTVRRSLASEGHILSLIDGKPYQALRRYLSTHGLTPEDYRRRYNLKPDYPMVAETYSAARREMALKIGRGAKGRNAKMSVEAPEPNANASPAKRGRKPGQPS